jgi:hypothetical protein
MADLRPIRHTAPLLRSLIKLYKLPPVFHWRIMQKNWQGAQKGGRLGSQAAGCYKGGNVCDKKWQGVKSTP